MIGSQSPLLQQLTLRWPLTTILLTTTTAQKRKYSLIWLGASFVCLCVVWLECGISLKKKKRHTKKTQKKTRFLFLVGIILDVFVSWKSIWIVRGRKETTNPVWSCDACLLMDFGRVSHDFRCPHHRHGTCVLIDAWLWISNCFVPIGSCFISHSDVTKDYWHWKGNLTNETMSKLRSLVVTHNRRDRCHEESSHCPHWLLPFDTFRNS